MAGTRGGWNWMRHGLAVAMALGAALFPLAAEGGSLDPAVAERLVLVNADDLQRTRERLDAGDRELAVALQSLIKAADKALDTPVVSVVDKPHVPPSGDKRDYMSLSPYWWPDPSKEDGLPYIWRDGEVNPEREQFDLPKLEAVAYAVRELGFAYHFTGEEKYAEHAAKLLRTFFLDEEKGMQPNLKYAQFRPGRTMTSHSGIIETNRFRWMIDAMTLMEPSEAWTDADAQGMRDWFRQYVQWLTQSEQGRKEAAAKNNHGTWHAAQVVLFARFAGDDETARQVLATIPDRIAAQIEPDGSQPHEATRTKSLHYHDFNLRALLDLAHMGKPLGVDLAVFETEDGRSIRKGVDYLVPYVLGEKKWPHKQISDISRGNFAMEWRMASRVFNDPTYETYIERLPGEDPLDTRMKLAMPPIDTKARAQR